MAEKQEHVPVQAVSTPVVRAIEVHLEATFIQGDHGVLSEQNKFSDIESAIEGVQGLENVKITHFKALSAEDTQKKAEKEEAAQRKAEKKAAEEAEES